MQLNTQYPFLPQMNTESNNRDKALDKISAAVELKLDDSASRSIASMMQNDISTFTQELMNTNDSISMMQIADGTLSSLSDQTQTLSDLSVRYNNATFNDSQKQGLSQEFNRTLESMNQSIQTASYNGQPLFNTLHTFGSSTISLGSMSTGSLAIDNQESISKYFETISQTQSDVGSMSNGLVSSANTLLNQMTTASAARSQIADTDIAKTIQEYQQSSLKLDASQMVLAHQNDALRLNIAQLLG
jgi:flagellin